MPFQILKDEEVYRGKFRSLHATTYQDKSGKKGVWEWMQSKDFVSVIGITREHQLLFIKQYRVANQRYCYGTVSGIIDPTDASPLEAAKREFLEETGYSAETFAPLRPSLNASGSQGNTFYPFLAVNAFRVNDNRGDVTEDIEVVTIPADELYEFYQQYANECDFNIRIIAMYELGKHLGLI